MSESIKQKYDERKMVQTENEPHYVKIKANRPIPPVKFKVSEEKDNECKCKRSDLNPCGPAKWPTACINYTTMVECNSNCPAKDRCQNQRFVNRIYSKVEIKNFESKGWRLVALQNISCNEFIIEYVGDVINNDEFNRRFKQSVEEGLGNFYFMRLENGLYIDSGIRGNEARFINHSCEPNSISQKWTVNGRTRIGIFAVADIAMVNFTHLLSLVLFKKKHFLSLAAY